jgi:hypothetical protein
MPPTCIFVSDLSRIQRGDWPGIVLEEPSGQIKYLSLVDDILIFAAR